MCLRSSRQPFMNGMLERSCKMSNLNLQNDRNQCEPYLATPLYLETPLENPLLFLQIKNYKKIIKKQEITSHTYTSL